MQERSCFWERGSRSLRIRDDVGCWGRQDFQINIPSHHLLIHRAYSAAESQGFLQIIKYLAYHIYETWCSYLVAPRRVFLSKAAQCVFSLPAYTVNDEEMTKFSIVTTFHSAWEVQVSCTRGAKVCLDLQSLQIQSTSTNSISVTQDLPLCPILRKGGTAPVSKWIFL